MQPPSQTSSERSNLLRSHDGLFSGLSPGGMENTGRKINRFGRGGSGGICETIAQAPLRGIYLRPTVFMIDGTARHLMEVLYPLNNDSSSSSSATTTTNSTSTFSLPAKANEENSMWWGSRYPYSRASWVVFEYSLAPALLPSAAAETISKTPSSYTEEELVRELPFHMTHSAESAQWLLEAAKRMSRSLRENRHSAPFRVEYCGTVGKLFPPRRVSVPLGGDAECLRPGGSVLLGGVEVAVRAMRPGEEFAFIIINPTSIYDDVQNAYGTHFSHNPAAFPMRCVYIRIKLLNHLPREPLWLPIAQKYILNGPSSTPPSQLDWMKTTSEDVHGCMLPLLFFSSSLFFTNSSDATFLDAVTYKCALRALFVSNGSAFLNCHVVGHPGASVAFLLDAMAPHSQSGLAGAEQLTRRSPGGTGTTAQNNSSSKDGRDNEEEEEVGGGRGRGRGRGENVPTDEEALKFLRLAFFSVPRDGATLSCSVTRRSPLTGSMLRPRSLAGVELGSMSLPLWLDVLLQTMRGGEEEIVNMQHNCEDDGAFQCSLANDLRTSAFLQSRVMEDMHVNNIVQRERPEEQGTPLDMSIQSPNSASSAQTLLSDGLRGEFGSKNFPPHELHCRISLESFANVHDVASFFFVDPANSLRVVQKLEQEANALRKLGSQRLTESQRQSKTDKEKKYHFKKISRRNENRSNIDGEDLAIPACAMVEPMTVHPRPFGHISEPFEERGIVKAIQKLELVVLLLTFHVNERSMIARGVSFALMEKRLVALMATFRDLGRLYTKLRHEAAWTLAMEAFSAAILLAPRNPQLWMRRGVLRLKMHKNHSAMCDLSRAKLLAEAGLRRLYFSRGSETCEGGGEGAIPSVSTATASTSAAVSVGPAAAGDFSAHEESTLRHILVNAETLLTELRLLAEERDTTPSASHQTEAECEE
ncbi:hypothetical protein TcG_01614 [Trypanosoma cruzi]|nr:hypothetical protein TcG_01614 [Trypanosoma cruzi]